MYLLRICAVLMAFLSSGCWPKGCFDRLAELKHAQPQVEKVLMQDDFGHKKPAARSPHELNVPNNIPGPVSLPRTPTCTEFADIQAKNQEIVLFVDKNASPIKATGAQWHSAFPSIGMALNRAFHIHAEALKNGAQKKKIYIIVAGATYGLTHEKNMMRANAGNGPIISIDEYAPHLHSMLEIRGHYRAGDRCLELDKNIQADPQGYAGRETILDGEDTSNHVVDIADAEHITIAHITLVGGNAKDITQAHKSMGGGVLIRGSSHTIRLNNLVIKNSQANDKGGGIAIIDDAYDVVVDSTRISGCQAHYGGGVALLGNAHDVRFYRSHIVTNNAKQADGAGGGVAIVGGVYDAKFSGVTIEGNLTATTTPGDGVGVWIQHDSQGGHPDRILFDHQTKIHNHKNGRQGAGMFAVGAKNLILDGVTFEDNHGIQGGGFFARNCHIQGHNNVTFARNIAQDSGGGLWVDGSLDVTLVHNQPLVLDNATCAGNTAINHGGCLYATASGHGLELVVQGTSTVRDNVAGQQGGACYFPQLRKLRVADGVRFSTNTATLGSGGAVFANFIRPGLNDTVLDVASGAVFSHNHADGSNRQGGAIFAQTSPRVARIFATFSANTAHSGGGGVTFAGAPDIDEIITSTTTKFENNKTLNHHGGGLLVAPTVTLQNAHDLKGNFIGNEAPAGNGGAVAILGPIIVLGHPLPAQVRVSEALFDSNSALHSPALYIAQVPPAGLAFDTVRFENTQLANQRHVVNQAGGLMAIATPIRRFIVHNVRISGFRTTAGHGGAFYVDSITHALQINRSRMELNAAENGGGGFLYVANPSPNLNVSFHDARFVANKGLGGDGGAVRIPQAHDVTMTNSITVPDMVAMFEGRYQGLHANNKLVGNEQIAKSHKNEAHGSGGVFWFGPIGGALMLHDQVLLDNRAHHGDGGALFVTSVAGNTSMVNPMFSTNNSYNHGGALYIGQAHNVSMRAHASIFAAKKEPRERFLPNDMFGSIVSVLTWNAQVDSLNNFGVVPNFAARYRGQFLMEENRAVQGNGGALYIGSADTVSVERMPFRANEAGSTGGTIYVGNVRTNLEINRSMILLAKARDNGAAVLVRGSNTVGDRRELELKNSNLQENQVVGQAGVEGAAGLYAENMNSLHLAMSNFYGNKVTNAPAGTAWAAAVKFLDRADPAPAINPLYNPALPVGVANMPLAVVGVEIPIYIIGPIEFKDNVVQGHVALSTTGTISVPQALKNSVHYFVYNLVFPHAAPATPFSISGNIPAPPSNAAVAVVRGH